MFYEQGAMDDILSPLREPPKVGTPPQATDRGHSAHTGRAGVLRAATHLRDRGLCGGEARLPRQGLRDPPRLGAAGLPAAIGATALSPAGGRQGAAGHRGYQGVAALREAYIDNITQ